MKGQRLLSWHVVQFFRGRGCGCGGGRLLCLPLLHLRHRGVDGWARGRRRLLVGYSLRRGQRRRRRAGGLATIQDRDARHRKMDRGTRRHLITDPHVRKSRKERGDGPNIYIAAAEADRELLSLRPYLLRSTSCSCSYWTWSCCSCCPGFRCCSSSRGAGVRGRGSCDRHGCHGVGLVGVLAPRAETERINSRMPKTDHILEGVEPFSAGRRHMININCIQHIINQNKAPPYVRLFVRLFNLL
mmetsp:Transcript_25307/g.63705  ORF Transcript_25307/g.63705 Transcript_25307/m.63705 type:complete len:243 (-) Transcript_25307:19-747(-)